MRYCHSSHNQARVFEVPHLINNQEDFDAFIENIVQEDILEWVQQQCENTKWMVVYVTNMTVFVSKIQDHPIGGETKLPDYIKKTKAIVGLDVNAHGHMRYTDNLCFFRALALYRGTPYKPSGAFEQIVRGLFEEIVGGNPEQFEGIHLSDLPTFEQRLEMNIMVFELRKREDDQVVAQIVQQSQRRYVNTMYLNFYENHFSLNTNLDLYCKSFECRQCHKLCKGAWEMNRHECTCNQVTKKKFVGGSYQPEPTVFELLADEGITIDDEKQFYPYRITYDFESYFCKEDVPALSEKLTWEAKHIPLSVSVCSNIPGYQEPRCFVTEGDPEKLVSKMVDYMHQIQTTAEAYLHEEHSDYYNALLELVQQKQQFESNEEDMDMTDETTEELEKKEKKSHPLAVLKFKYEQWMMQIPVIGFNSGKYDINKVKPYLVKSLMENDLIKFVVKKSNAFMCITTEQLKFVDIRNYLAPGFDYATYLKVYKCTVLKGYFPYEWMDNLEKLKQTCLPAHQEFYSTLKNSNITEEEYAYCQRIWKEEDMTAMNNYLVWYNNRDVAPFWKP